MPPLPPTPPAPAFPLLELADPVDDVLVVCPPSPHPAAMTPETMNIDESAISAIRGIRRITIPLMKEMESDYHSITPK
jgi:hypothetical protein